MIYNIDFFLDDISCVVKVDSPFYIKPNIPQAKLLKSIKSYAKNVRESDVLVLADATLFGGAKEGFILTNDRIYCKALFGEAKSFLFQSINNIEARDGVIFINGNEFFNFGSSYQKELNLVVSLLASYLNLFTRKFENPENHNLLELYFLETKKVKDYVKTFDENGILDIQFSELFFTVYKKYHIQILLSLKLNLKDILWHIKTYNLVLDLIKKHEKSSYYKEHLHKLYTNDISISFCFLWLKFCTKKILKENHYSTEKIDSITNLYDYLIKAFVLYRNIELKNKSPNWEELNLVFTDSILGNDVNNWLLYFNSFEANDALNNLSMISHHLFMSLSYINDNVNTLLVESNHTEIDYEYLNNFLLDIYNQVNSEFAIKNLNYDDLDNPLTVAVG